jgi:hypothetical protein
MVGIKMDDKDDIVNIAKLHTLLSVKILNKNYDVKNI